MTTISTGLVQVNNRIDVVDGRVSTLEITLQPFAQASETAKSRGGLAIVSVSGGATENGEVITQGRNFGVLEAVDTSTRTVLKGAGTTDPTFNVNAALCTSATGIDTTATGVCARAGVNSQTVGASAYGSNAWALEKNSTAVGFRATATGDNSVALGANSTATEANTVSVGSVELRRRITNLADGIADADAATFGQVKTAYTGVAMSMAFIAIDMGNVGAGEKAFGAGIGSFKGKSAIGTSFKAVSQDGSTSFRAGVATDGTDYGLNIGVAWKWK